MDEPCSPLLPGTTAPDFTLPRSSYASVSLADVRGRRVILVFYPADWEPVSQEQLTLYQDHLAEFRRLGAVLRAVSTDHLWCHSAFARAAGIHYSLLADSHPHGAVSRAYGVYVDGFDWDATVTRLIAGPPPAKCSAHPDVRLPRRVDLNKGAER